MSVKQKLKGFRPMKHGGVKSAQSAPSQQAAAAPAGGGGGKGTMALSAPKTLKSFGHPTPDLKQLSTDRGSFKIKG